jgi:tetratricopeptide (TPR) repeat protein
MAKKGKSKKARKKADQRLQNMPAAQLAQRGEALLAAGNYREAIQVLKISHKKQKHNHQTRAMLFRAYTLRENQLRQKGLVQEAEALQQQIMQYQPDPAQLNEADLLICLRSTSPGNAVSLYSRFLVHHKPIHEAEVVLAGALLTSSDWQATARLPDTALLKPDLPILEKASRILKFDDLFEDTQEYLELLDEEFPDPADRSMAASMVLSESVARFTNFGIGRNAVDLNPYGPDNPGNQPEIASSQAEGALLEMILKALELDPQNPQIYDLLTQLPRTSRKAKQLAETGLLKMRDSIPDDPRPCIALAGLYNEKNAFRKAEKCLRQAEQLAPHDEQVKEFRVLALLKSIDANLKRKKNHLVRPDLEKAESLCGKKTLAHVTSRRIVFEIQQTAQMSLFDDRLQPEEKGRVLASIESHIAPLPAAQRLKTLAAFIERSVGRRTHQTMPPGNSSALENRARTI